MKTYHDVLERMKNDLFQHCTYPNPAPDRGAICLGADALVYSSIVSGFRTQRGPGDQISFDPVSIECDDGHPEPIRNITVDIAKSVSQLMNHMRAADQALVGARLRLFDDIQQVAASA